MTSRRLRACLAILACCTTVLAATPVVASAAAPRSAASKARPAQKAPVKKKSARARKPASKPAPVDPALAAAIGREAGGKFDDFYASRGNRPLWFEGGRLGPAAPALLSWISDARVDGLKPSRYDPDELHAAIVAAETGGAQARAAAEIALTRTFLRYLRDMRKTRSTGMEFAEDSVRPPKLDDGAILRVATMRDFPEYVAGMGWMSPHYLRMRELLGAALDSDATRGTIERLETNLERARVLPSAAVRHIVVDAASARLWYYENGRQVGTMRVVVGARETQTPMLAGAVNWTILNPYWNVPDYLVRDNVAKKVLAGRSLASMHMQVLSDWSEKPAVVDPATVDWQAVAAGRLNVRVRELPGPSNSMGRVKFLFPNDKGIYLHDTPNRDLLAKDDRHFSNGCIRLEKASQLGRWLMGKPLPTRLGAPEQPLALPVPVPVYITYLTAGATANGRQVAMLDDVYGRDP